MPYQTSLPAALRARGLVVETVPGWKDRGNESFHPRGSVSHWTAGPHNAPAHTRPSLNICVNGRPGLPGPLCNVYLDRRGVAVVVAAGRANHAGAGGWKGLSGNSSVFGTEAESGGDVPFSDWTDAQREAYPKINAAFMDLCGNTNADLCCGHSEWTPRKIDIRDWDMARMRRQVNKILAAGPSGKRPKEDVMNKTQEKKLDKALADIDWLKNRVGGTGKVRNLTDYARRLEAQNTAQGAALAALAQSKGVDSATVQKAIADAMADFELTLGPVER